MALTDYKKAFHNMIEWILKVLNILKMFPFTITFLKYNLGRWIANFRSIHEKIMLKINNLHII